MAILASWLGPRQSFAGGLYLSDHKAVTARMPIETIAAGGPLVVPLQASARLPATPVVAVGDAVLGGQALSAPSNPGSVAVHAPTSGRIVRLEEVWTVYGERLEAAVLEPDGRNAQVAARTIWDEESFIAQVALSGVVCTAPRDSAHAVIQAAVSAGASDLIVNAMETEPYLTADLRTLVEEPGRIVDAACEIADAMGVGRVIIAVSERHRRVNRRLVEEAVGRHLEVIALSEKYPQCHPIVLVKTVLDREIPPGGSPLDVRACVLPLATVRDIAGAILDDRPTTHTVMTIAGDAVVHAGTYRVPIGMPLARLAMRVGVNGPIRSAACGGPLTGIPILHEDAVITADTVALLLMRSVEQREATACIHCGWCIEDCPVGLDPIALVSQGIASGNGRTGQLVRACIDCGLCSFNCPSHIPLAAQIQQMRVQIDRAEAEAGH
jgi:electron transport complex protein RnfC